MISQEELPHTEKCFTEINGYLKWLLKQMFDSFETNSKHFKKNINNKNNADIANLSDKPYLLQSTI